MTSPVTDFATGFVSSTAVKQPVECATTANITLEGLQTVDGISVTAGMRVLVKNQTVGAENGIYIASTGAWTRAADLNDNNDVQKGTRVFVASGSVNSGNEFYISTDNQVIIDTSPIAWTQYPRPLSFNITRAQISSTVIPFTSIAVSGYATPGDLGAGAVYVRGASSGPMAIQDAAGTWWNLAYDGQPVSLGWFGAKGDGVTDDKDAIQNWLYFIGVNNLTGYLPRGRFRKPNNRGELLLAGNIRIIGEGKFDSIIFHDDSVQSTRRDLFYDGNVIDSLDIEGIGFEGTWGDDDDWAQRSQLAGFQPTGGRARVVNCSFRKANYMSLVIVGASEAHVEDCTLDLGLADGIRLIDCGKNSVQNNHLSRINDDAIAIHTLDSSGDPAKQTINVGNNTLVDCQGIRILGGKSGVVADNTLIRCQGHAIAVQCGSSGSTEGVTSLLNFTITGNVLVDMFNGHKFSSLSADFVGWIVITDAAPNTITGGYYAFGPNGSGGIVSPYPYFYDNATDSAGQINVGAFAFNISNNVCVRTLGPTAAYSDYGYGVRYSRGGPSDPEIVAADILGHQVHVSNTALRNSVISDNVLWGGARAIYLGNSASNAYVAFSNVSIDNNNICNVSSGCIYAIGKGTINARGNTFDGDPLHVHSGRLANGKWTSGTSFPAIQTDTARLILQENTFRNVYSMYSGTSMSQQVWLDNVIACNPTGIGFNADNIGIGDIYVPEFFGTLLVEDGDPASSTYGQVLNTCLRAHTGIPSSGKYVSGHFCKNLFPAISSGKVLLGWSRLTTGTGHTAGTDWTPLYCTTS